MENKIYKNVALGQNGTIQVPCVIGYPPREKIDGELSVVIGDNHCIRSFTTIYAGVTIGDGLETGHHVLIREDNVIGDNVSIGTNSMIEIRNRIGNNVRIHGGCFLEDVTIEDDVFVGPCVVFTDDKYPPDSDYLKKAGGPIIRRGARIGAHVTILPGVDIGEGSLIGAGSVVTKNVPSGMLAYGNPAKVVKDIGNPSVIN